MKTSVIQVRDMLSVLSVQGVEERIGEVPGVESVTVNYAAGTATVRHDETRLNIADIKSAVRQAEYEADAASPAVGHEGHSPTHSSPTTTAPVGEGPTDKAMPGAPPAAPLAPAAPRPPPAIASTSSAPQPGPDAAVEPPGGAAPADHAEHGKASPEKA